MKSSENQRIFKGDEDKSHMGEIEKIREKIDQIDEKILGLLAERAICSKKIAALKRKKGVAIIQLQREKKALMSRKKSAKDKNLSGTFTERLFKAIFNESRRIQKRQLATLTKKAKNDKL